MRKSLVALSLFFALAAAPPASADWKPGRALEVARVVWHNDCVNRASIVVVPFGQLEHDARADTTTCTILMGENVRTWNTMCSLVIHESGHLANFTDPTNTGDVLHSSNPRSIMHSPITAVDPRCDQRGRPYLIKMWVLANAPSLDG